MTHRTRFVIALVIFLPLLSCSPATWFTPTSTPTLPATPSASSTPTPTHTSTFTLIPTPTATRVPAAYQTLNVNEYGSYTLFWKRELWEKVAVGSMETEDFESVAGDYGELSFPFVTGKGFILDGGQVSAQIISDSSLLMSENFLHFRSWGSGLRIIFPDESTMSSFGFDFRASEEWRLTIENIVITIPKGRAGFVGIVMLEGFPSKFILSSLEYAQGGLSIDNISYSRSDQP